MRKEIKSKFPHSMIRCKPVGMLLSQHRKTEKIIQLKNKNAEIYKFIGKPLPSSNSEDLRITCTLAEDSITVVSFWNIHCPPCIKELTVFNWLSTDFPEVTFVAVTNDSASEVASFLNTHNLHWKNLTLICDYKGSLEIASFPANLILGKDKMVKNIFIGSNLREVIISLDTLSKSSIP